MPDIRIPSGSSTAAAAATAQRYQALMSAEAYYAETGQRKAHGSTQIMITGTAYFVSIGLAAGDVVTNIHALCSTLGSGFSGIGMKVGLYDKTGVRLALSADVSATFGSTGAKVCPLTAPYTVLTTDGYYAAIISIATTCPILARSSTGVFGAAFTGGMIDHGVHTAQTDLPAPATIANGSLAIGYWLGVS